MMNEHVRVSRDGIPGKRLGTGLVLMALCALVGCSGGGAGDPTVVGTQSGGQENDGSGETVSDGEIVAKVSLRAPDETSFLLRATLPVPPGVVRENAEQVPLAVVDSRNKTLPTQVNVVTRYPAAEDGAAVVEVMALVNKPKTVKPGTEMSFHVAWHEHPKGPMLINKQVRDLLADGSALRLTTSDVFGHEYEAELFAPVLDRATSARMTRRGQLVNEYAVHSVLEPVSPAGGSQGTMPHMMGVHTYVSTYSKKEFFGLDLHIHNGMDGLDKGSPSDDALREIFFRSLDLRLPQGWSVAVCFPNPTTGEMTEDGGATVFPIVEPLPDGKMHFMPQQARFVRRMVVYRDAVADEALATLGQEYLAFCRPGQSPTGKELWSWWNRDTANFLPQAHRLPDLSFLDADEMREGMENQYADYKSRVLSGAKGSYPIQFGGFGWAHPWGVAYGGMTGGDEIEISTGVELAWTGSREGYLLEQLTARCYLDRQPTALYSVDGVPTRYEELLVTEGQGAPYVDVSFFLVPKDTSDPFGFTEAPTFQTQAVQNQGKLPPYHSLASWMPIDYQHYIRMTRSLKVLAWLGNDSIAKDQLEAASEIFRLSFHEYPSGAWGYVSGSSLKARMDHVAEYPGVGVDYQRGEAWGTDASIAAYALGDDDVRERYYPWFVKLAQMVEDGQSTCTGNVMASYMGKLFDGGALVRYTGHTSYADNSLQGIRRQVFEGRDQERAERLGDVIAGTAYAQISAGFWNEGAGQPWTYVGVGDPGSKEDWCNDLPHWANSGYTTNLHYYSSFAYAYEVTGDEIFLFRAAQALGGGDLLSRLKESGTSNLKATASLLATVQSPPEE